MILLPRIPSAGEKIQTEPSETIEVAPWKLAGHSTLSLVDKRNRLENTY